MTTEIAIVPLIDGELSPASKDVLQGVFETLTQQPGFQRAYWGRTVEDPAVARFFVDWDSVGMHMEFIGSAGYSAFIQEIGNVADLSRISLYHAHLTPHAPSILTSAPVIELLTIFFPPNYTSTQQLTFNTNMSKLTAVLATSATEYKGYSGGWVEEDVAIPATAKGRNVPVGEKAKAFVLLLGWSSVEAHVAFRDSGAFKDNIYLLRGAEGLVGYEGVHVEFQGVGRGKTRIV